MTYIMSGSKTPVAGAEANVRAMTTFSPPVLSSLGNPNRSYKSAAFTGTSSKIELIAMGSLWSAALRASDPISPPAATRATNHKTDLVLPIRISNSLRTHSSRDSIHFPSPDADGGRGIVPIRPPGRVIEVDHVVAVVGDDGVAESDATDPLPSGKRSAQK